jgi:hypothetical protein
MVDRELCVRIQYCSATVVEETKTKYGIYDDNV